MTTPARRPAPPRDLEKRSGLLPEDHSEIKIVSDARRDVWFRHSDPWKVDHRRTCSCGHRYNVHATGGTKCLAAGEGEGNPSFCGCYEWTP